MRRWLLAVLGAGVVSGGCLSDPTPHPMHEADTAAPGPSDPPESSDEWAAGAPCPPPSDASDATDDVTPSEVVDPDAAGDFGPDCEPPGEDDATPRGADGDFTSGQDGP